MSIVVYGIKNCNSMKKAFDKLSALGVAYEFFDYKKQVLSHDEFANFVAIFGDKVINKQGTTYRKLDDDTKAVLSSGDVDAMYKIVKDNQSMIKRPIVLGGSAPVIGYDESEFEKVFS